MTARKDHFLSIARIDSRGTMYARSVATCYHTTCRILTYRSKCASVVFPRCSPCPLRLLVKSFDHRATGNTEAASLDGELFPQQIFHVPNLVAEHVHLIGQALDLGFGPAVHLEIQFAADAIFLVLTVLAHHDDRRLNGREHGEKQVEKNEWIRVPGAVAEPNVYGRIDDQNHEECGNKSP